MIGRFFRSRGMRKSRRDRLAVAASCVIGVYLAIAVAIFFFGLVTEEETFARVGPNNDVGFLEQPTLEQRVHHLEFYLEKPYEAAESREPEKALARIDYAGATVIEATPDELIERIDPLWETFDELIELLEEEVLADDPEALARLAELEAEAAFLYVRPEGYAAWGHHLARFLGTDAGERWPIEEFKGYVHEHFPRGGWTYHPHDRVVVLSRDGLIAWFDEELTNAGYGELRGTGALRRQGGVWRITHYSMTFTIPNDVAPEVVDLVRNAAAEEGGAEGDG